jgi:hypothetical protein
MTEERKHSMDCRTEMILDAVSSGKGFDGIRKEILENWLDSLPEKSRLVILGFSNALESLLSECPQSLERHTAVHVFLPQDLGGRNYQIHPVSMDEALHFNPERVLVLRRRIEYMNMAEAFEKRGISSYTIRDIVDCSTASRYSSLIDGIIEKETGRHVDAIRSAAGEKPMVCLAMFHMFHQYVKLAGELKKNGYSVILFTGYPVLEGAGDTSAQVFDYSMVSNLSYGLELDFLLARCGFSFLHIVADMSGTLPIALSIESGHCPVITDYNDFKQIVFRDDRTARIQASLSETEYMVEKQAQSYVFRKSQGIVYKDSPEVIDFLSKQYGKAAKPLSFKPYCSAFEGKTKPPGKKSGDPIRIVYAGGLPPESRWHSYSIDGSLMETIEKLTAQGIMFTLFNAGDFTGTGYEKYFRIAEENPFFEYRKALPYDALVREIESHDFGFHCFDYSGCLENRFFIDNSFPSKVFTYLDAGLPVIVNRDFRYVSDYVESNGLGVSIGFSEIGNLKTVLESQRVRSMVESIEEKRKSFSYKAHFHEFLDFYHESQRNWRHGR